MKEPLAKFRSESLIENKPKNASAYSHAITQTCKNVENIAQPIFCTHTCTEVTTDARAFTPGLLYVMLSRVTNRDKLRIVSDGPLSPDLFVPMKIPTHAPRQH